MAQGSLTAVDAAREQATAADTYATTGTSPTSSARSITSSRVAWHAQARTARRTYETVHLLGPGAVGRALLERFTDNRRRVIAVTDSTATLHDPAGLDTSAVIAWKNSGRPLSDHPHAHVSSATAAVAHVDADIVADCSSTDLDRPGWTETLGAALSRGACITSAAKAALCDAGAEWLSGEHRSRVGCNAVLGGTGRAFLAELPELQRRVRGIAIVGNASTTAIIDVIERGGTFTEGVAEAQRLGYLEPDPELDLRGADAAVKLAIVAGIVTSRRIDPRSIDVQDIRSVDPVLLRARARGGRTTRLVGRLADDGNLRASYEDISRDSLLAAPCGRVVYEYRLTRDERRLHIGSGLGAKATAGAVWSDICALASEAALNGRSVEVQR